MTKVIISPSFLEYRQTMASAVEQVRREYNIAGLKPCGYQVPFQPPEDAVSAEPGLLKPPYIEIVVCNDPIAIRDGQVHEIIQFWTWGDYGPLYVSVNLLDEEGELLESDYAIPSETLLNHWAYFIEMEAGDHRSLTLQAGDQSRLFAYQRYDRSDIVLYYVPLVDMQNGQPFTPIELPSRFFSTAREKPQPALRPAE
jgi:hypothetical protein